MYMAMMKIALSGLIAVTLGAGCAAPQSAAPATPSAATAAPSTPTAAPSAATCTVKVTDAAVAQGGTCLEAAVLGAEVVAACGDWLVARGWVRDAAAEAAIGGQTGKKLACYHAP